MFVVEWKNKSSQCFEVFPELKDAARLMKKLRDLEKAEANVSDVSVRPHCGEWDNADLLRLNIWLGVTPELKKLT